MITACIVSFIVGAVGMLCAIGLMSYQKDKKPQNKVHFYVARDKNGSLWLYMGKPVRCNNEFSCNLDNNYAEFMCEDYSFKFFGLNENDYKDLKWEDEPVEVFVSIKVDL